VAGRVEGIFVTDTKRVLPEPVERVDAIAGTGLRGNRYFYADGDAPPGRAITLISAEALEAFESESGIPLSAAESRRNVLVRGIDVNALVGKRFRIGEVECEGVQLCEPCTTLQSLTRPGVLQGMVHRAGLNADLLTTGEIAVGDTVTAE
jgi:MOSC domain-containing protein YiiM